MEKRAYSWKFIPLIFLVHFLIQALVVYNTAQKLPEYSISIIFSKQYRFTKVGFPTNFDQAKAFAETFRGYLETNYIDLIVFQFSSFLL